MEQLAGKMVFLLKLFIDSTVSVLIISDDRMSDGSKMGADLMCLSRDQVDF